MTASGFAGHPDGPAVVAVGGGHGLAATLRAARCYARRVTAIVAVADDGGSSGRLRDELGMPAPGDLRRCLAALADPGSVLGRALDHRFDDGELAGHAVGNLLIAGLHSAGGDFVAAIDEVGRLVGLGPWDAPPEDWPARVLPAADEPVVLTAATATGEVRGQLAVSGSAGIARLGFEPAAPTSPAAVATALASADQVVLGPGSLYTSVLAAAAVPGVREALASTTARKVYVGNLGPERRETEGLIVADHVDALAAHGVDVNLVLCHPGALARGDLQVECSEAPVARPHGRAHDPDLLASALASLG